MRPQSNSMVPRPAPGIDIRQLPIGPEEAFVLSRVDGQATAREIGYATSLTEEQVTQHLRRLESLGAVNFGEHSPLSNPVLGTKRATEASPESTSRSDLHATAAKGVTPPPSAPSYAATSAVSTPQGCAVSPTSDAEAKNSGITDARLYDVKELDDPADLDTGKKQEILDLYYRLDAVDHYCLLGTPTNADRRTIKAAYYEKVKVFHPDRYFGKNLGSFRAKLEQCFERLTEAHDTLTTASTRAEYDSYLESQRHTIELERALSQTVTINDFDLLEQQLDAAIKATASMTPLASADTLPRLGAIREPVVEVVGWETPSGIPKMSDEERKRFLARKLRVSSANLRAVSRTPSVAPAQSAPPPSREQIAQQLRRQLGGSRREEHTRQVEGHLSAADAATIANNPVAAANSLRLAQSLAPDDPSIAERLTAAQSLAAQALSDTYLHQGEYEEKSSRFEAAARSYERAAQGKPSAEVWEAAARCALEAGADLRAAAEYARKSVVMNSERPTSHLLLGRIFLAAQMRSSAIAELERARRLDPNNDTVLSLLKRIANKEI